MSKQRLKGKWALVTGASRGIGQQIAQALASEGANLVLHGRKPEHMKETEKLIKPFKLEHITVGAELNDETQIAALVKTVFAATGGVDILYNNAAVMAEGGARIWDIPMKQWYEVFEINFFAVVRLCNAFAPEMKKRKWGRIINLTTGMQNEPDLSTYSVSKAAIDKYSRELAWALKDDNVLVSYLDPGWLKTDLGGPNAWFTVDTVIPGALVPALLEDKGSTGQLWRAQDFKNLSL